MSAGGGAEDTSRTYVSELVHQTRANLTRYVETPGGVEGETSSGYSIVDIGLGSTGNGSRRRKD